MCSIERFGQFATVGQLPTRAVAAAAAAATTAATRWLGSSQGRGHAEGTAEPQRAHHVAVPRPPQSRGPFPSIGKQRRKKKSQVETTI